MMIHQVPGKKSTSKKVRHCFFLVFWGPFCWGNNIIHPPTINGGKISSLRRGHLHLLSVGHLETFLESGGSWRSQIPLFCWEVFKKTSQNPWVF